MNFRMVIRIKKFAEFCTGIGGFRLGIESSSSDWECVYACDIDKKCNDTYNLNFGHSYNAYDIFDIDENKLEYFDMLCSGFPCQPFSQAGEKKGFNDPRGNIFFKLIDIVKSVRPKVAFLENVPFILKHDNGKTIETIKSKFEQIKYKLHIMVLNSSNFMVPQSRPRVYFVAFREDIDDSHFKFTKITARPKALKHYLNPGDYSIPISNRWNEYIDLYTGIKSIEEMSFKVPITRKGLEKVNEGTDLKDCIFQIRSSGIRAISLEKVYPTFAVSNSGGGAMIPVLSKERRHMNLIEIKRIMGFPDDFKFEVSRTDSIKQLANAVCPPVIESITKDISKII